MAQPPTAPGMSLQHSKCVKYVVNGEVMSRQGAMVAFRGHLQFEVKARASATSSGAPSPARACR